MQQTSKKNKTKNGEIHMQIWWFDKQCEIQWGSLRKKNRTKPLFLASMIGLCCMFCTGTPAKKITRKTGQSSFKFTSFEFPMTFEPFFGKRIHSLVWLTGNCVGV